jgi:hypothetical protein
MKYILFTLGLSCVVLFSCKKDKAVEPTTTSTPLVVKFATDIQPIFQQSCGTGGSCHGSINQADGKVYETHAGAIAVNDALTIGSIKHSTGYKAMPQIGPQLSSDKIAKIEAWINSGKKND